MTMVTMALNRNIFAATVLMLVAIAASIYAIQLGASPAGEASQSSGPSQITLPMICATVEVLKVTTSSIEIDRKTPPNPSFATPQIIPSQMVPRPSPHARQPMTVFALGPVLGSRDSDKIDVKSGCTQSGFYFSATVLRAASYPEATLGTTVQAKYPWRPKITITIIPYQSEITARMVWSMRLTTGIEVLHTQTPPFPEQRFPIVVSTTLRYPDLNGR